MSNAKDLFQYDQELDNAVKDNSEDVFYNDSILHAFIIMKHLFKKVKNEDRKQMNIFCGNFSLFRDKTKDKIIREKRALSLDDLSEDEKKRWDDWDLFDDLQSALKEFLETKGAKLDLIMMRDVDTLCENSVWPILKNAIDKKRLSIYSLSKDEDLGLGNFHFAVTSDAYRIESSDEFKKATCCFCDKDGSNILNSNFALLKDNSSLRFSKMSNDIR